MKRPSIFAGRRPMEVAMTPMIDVVFLLLVFFVWTASFQIVENILPSNLTAIAGTEPIDPKTPPPPEADFDDVVVRITWSGDAPRWTINQQSVANLAQLRGQLDQIARIKRDAPVILHPDQEVPLGDVIDVYDIARAVGFEKVQFAASETI